MYVPIIYMHIAFRTLLMFDLHNFTQNIHEVSNVCYNKYCFKKKQFPKCFAFVWSLERDMILKILYFYSLEQYICNSPFSYYLK